MNSVQTFHPFASLQQAVHAQNSGQIQSKRMNAAKLSYQYHATFFLFHVSKIYIHLHVRFFFIFERPRLNSLRRRPCSDALYQS